MYLLSVSKHKLRKSTHPLLSNFTCNTLYRRCVKTHCSWHLPIVMSQKRHRQLSDISPRLVKTPQNVGCPLPNMQEAQRNICFCWMPKTNMMSQRPPWCHKWNYYLSQPDFVSFETTLLSSPSNMRKVQNKSIRFSRKLKSNIFAAGCKKGLSFC